MQVTPRSRRVVRLQNIVFVVLLLGIVGVLAWLSTRYNYQADWTAGGRNTLSQASIGLLKKIQGPVTITAYARDEKELRKNLAEGMARYRRYKSDLNFSFINPDQEPERVREAGVTMDGELVVEYQGRSEHVRTIDEQNITNALQRLMRGGERWLVFIEGHGERKPQGSANHDLSSWTHQLESKGMKVQAINLVNTPQIPRNTAVLVIAGPQTGYLPGEIRAIQDYLDHGGNLLWLGDPGPDHGLGPVAKQLGIEFLHGVIVDPTTQLLSINNPAIAIVANYGTHPITRDFNSLTVFPFAVGVDARPVNGWESKSFLMTESRSWLETDALQGAVRFDAGKDVHGPLNIGIALSRSVPAAEPGKEAQGSGAAAQQRVAVLGDGDFLSNAYLSNVGNLDMGMNIINWLSQDDVFISIPAKTSPDTSLKLSQTAILFIGAGFLFVLPLILVGSGLIIWFRRRKR